MAALFGERAVLLDWAPPARPLPAYHRQPDNAPRIGFLGPTLGRKGAWEAREALGALRRGSFRLSILGAILEQPDFWAALEPEYRPLIAPNSFTDLDIVLAPAWVDHSPRRLIALLQAGYRVIATTACGLPPQAGLTLVEPGDSQALAKALAAATDGAIS